MPRRGFGWGEGGGGFDDYPKHDDYLRPKEKEIYDIEAKKDEQERLMHSASRPLEGPYWEGIKKKIQGVPEEELKSVMTLAMDYVWIKAVRLKQLDKGTDVEIPNRLKKYHRMKNEAPYNQELLRLGGRNYVLIEEFGSKKLDKDGRKVVVSEEYLEVGLLPGGREEEELFEERRGYVDLRKLEHYSQVVSVSMDRPWNVKSFEGFKDSEHITEEESKEEVVVALANLTGRAWDLRQLLFIWSGKYVDDATFEKHVRNKLNSVLVVRENRRALGFSVFDIKYLEQFQAVMLLDLIDNTGKSFDELFFKKEKDGKWRGDITIKTSASQELINKYKDLPGFRTWINKISGVVKMSAVKARDRAYQRDRTYDAGSGYKPKGDAPASLTDKDREYLREKPPAYQPNQFDRAFDALLPEVKKQLKGDLPAIIGMLEKEREVRPESVSYNTFILSILKDRKPEEFEVVRSAPAVVGYVGEIDEALLLGARHIVCAPYSQYGESRKKWGEFIEKLSQVTGKEMIPAEHKGISQYITELDLGRGKEEVLFEFIERPDVAYGQPGTFFQKQTLPYKKVSLIIDHDVVGDYVERKAMLTLLVKNGIFVSNGGINGPDWRPHIPHEDMLEIRSVNEESNNKDRERLEKTIDRYWQSKGFDYLSLPNYPKLDFTLVKKE